MLAAIFTPTVARYGYTQFSHRVLIESNKTGEIPLSLQRIVADWLFPQNPAAVVIKFTCVEAIGRGGDACSTHHLTRLVRVSDPVIIDTTTATRLCGINLTIATTSRLLAVGSLHGIAELRR